ncbi:Fe-Mn family superoxide dismutase [Paenibacillus anaericanus]|uniref:Fe-Mn family superoxide dismutase n=1 Tax=Paenibacillus anaericanus TaxID=170367 RepID=UPI00278A117E|nr:Fe-Mn family superoxide dismutase [Paenibacillus anaericanus]MDQ0089208.1 Fe-Mn family superoxide dismutase [Paenibacillus anaericanus]
MLFVYGPYLPVRILEEIRFWKEQEKEHTDVIKAIIPSLEVCYVNLLSEWQKVFAEVEQSAHILLQYALSSEQAACDPLLMQQTEQLLEVACRQSHEFIRQLYCILEQSIAVREVPLAKTVLLHIIRESEYFLYVLETLNRPGELASNVNNAPAILDPHYQTIVGSHTMISRDIPLSIDILEKEISELNTDLPTPEVRKDSNIREPNRSVPIGGHTLPPLPYAYNALEPYIDEKTMRIHHDKHHKAYVDDLNVAEKKLHEARKSGNFDLVKHWERELAFNGAGHYLHTIFWDTMSPEGGGKPEGELLEQIKSDLGSYDAFHNQFSKAAEKVEGGGWAVLVWSPRSHRLEILTAEKHQNLSQWDIVPLLPLDVWEHAYYLKHQNQRKDYIADWWNVVYWPEVAKRYNEAKKLKWQPF